MKRVKQFISYLRREIVFIQYEMGHEPGTTLSLHTHHIILCIATECCHWISTKQFDSMNASQRRLLPFAAKISIVRLLTMETQIVSFTGSYHAAIVTICELACMIPLTNWRVKTRLHYIRFGKARGRPLFFNKTQKVWWSSHPLRAKREPAPLWGSIRLLPPSP